MGWILLISVIITTINTAISWADPDFKMKGIQNCKLHPTPLSISPEATIKVYAYIFRVLIIYQGGGVWAPWIRPLKYLLFSTRITAGA